MDSKAMEAADAAAHKAYFDAPDETAFGLAIRAAISTYLSTLSADSGEIVERLRAKLSQEQADYDAECVDAEETGERPDLWDREISISVDDAMEASARITADAATIAELRAKVEAQNAELKNLDVAAFDAATRHGKTKAERNKAERLAESRAIEISNLQSVIDHLEGELNAARAAHKGESQ